MRVQWIGQSATARSSNVASLRALNCFAEIVESRQGKTAVALYGTPGLEVFGTVPGTGAMRSLFTAANGRCFAVRGAILYEVASDGTATARGSLLTSTGPIQMAENGVELLLVDGPYGYSLLFSNNGFTQLLDPDFHGSTRVMFIDNYLLVLDPLSQQFRWTDLVSVSFDALNFSSVEGSPDRLVSLLAAHRDLWLFGTETTEVWFNNGDLDNPFARIEAAFVQQGCAAAQSPARVGETVCVLAANEQGQGMVMQYTGYAPARVSTHAVETALERYDTLSDAIGWGEEREGHLWYVLTFPSAGATWVYDATTSLWHERAYLDPVTGAYQAHRASCHTVAFGMHLYGDRVDGRVYRSSFTAYTDAGDPLRREAVLPPVYDADGLARLFFHDCQLDLEAGVGLDGAPIPGTDPQVFLAWSNDGGHLFTPERAVSAGKIGAYTHRAKWYRLGAARDRRFRIAFSDPCKFAVVGAYVNMEKGVS